MALYRSLEQSGLFLFRHRGQIPLILFALAVPVVYSLDPHRVPDPIEWGATAFGILISFLGFVVRGIAIGRTPKGTSGRNTKEQVAETLNTSGIYSICRHPLYLGNYLIWIGIVIFTFHPWFFIVVSLLFWLYYERIMYAEERFLEKKFGDPFYEWSDKVPAFFPSFRNYRKSDLPFSWKSVLRREYSGFLATVIGFVFIAFLRDVFHSEPFRWDPKLAYILGAALLITLTLRTLKHHTRMLKEKDRS